jgi:Cu/Ag efflux pump CusA
MVIRCNTQDRDLASAVKEITERVDSQIDLPEGYFIEYGGQFESQQRATRTIVVLAGVSIVGMFVVLMLLFPSVRVVLQILNALPTAFWRWSSRTNHSRLPVSSGLSHWAESRYETASCWSRITSI